MEPIAIIEQALNIAVTKGCYTLAEVEMIINALKELKNEK